MRNTARKATGMSALAPALIALALAGCEDEKVVYVDDNPPAVPTGVYTITGDGWVEIRWNPVREDDVAGYGVYWNDTLDGAYMRLGEVTGMESTRFLHTGLSNGTTYFYAVDAFDFAGHESDLSYEDAFDTPRPEGVDVDVYAREADPQLSGIDFSQYPPSPFVTAFDSDSTDVFFQRIGQVLYAKGTVIDGWPNDIQDLGYTDSMDEVSWAPSEGWSVAPSGVELIEGHTYVVWTWNLHFAKFRVVSLEFAAGLPVRATIDWAYQVDNNNPELSPFFVSMQERPAREREAS
jgi:hypothetical protein